MIVMNRDSELDFYVTGCKSLVIACCVTHLKVPLSWELEIATLTKQQQLNFNTIPRNTEIGK